MAEVLSFQVPSHDYFLHQGHALVPVGLDDLSQKILADGLKSPAAGRAY
jgi:hypothetical protein